MSCPTRPEDRRDQACRRSWPDCAGFDIGSLVNDKREWMAVTVYRGVGVVQMSSPPRQSSVRAAAVTLSLRGPDLVGPIDDESAQHVSIDPIGRVPPWQVRLPVNRLQRHLLHQGPHTPIAHSRSAVALKSMTRAVQPNWPAPAIGYIAITASGRRQVRSAHSGPSRSRGQCSE